MKRISALIFMGLFAAFGHGALADSAFQAVPERSYLSFHYPSGRWRLPRDNTVLAFNWAWTDTTGKGIAATGALTFVDAQADSVGLWYWENVPAGMYFFVETTGTDSAFSHPSYYRMGQKMAPPASVDSAAVIAGTITTVHLSGDTLITDEKWIAVGVITGPKLTAGSVTDDKIDSVSGTKLLAGTVPGTAIDEDAWGRWSVPKSIDAETLSCNVVRSKGDLLHGGLGYTRFDGPDFSWGRAAFGRIFLGYNFADSLEEDKTAIRGIVSNSDSTAIRDESGHTVILMRGDSVEVFGNLIVHGQIKGAGELYLGDDVTAGYLAVEDGLAHYMAFACSPGMTADAEFRFPNNTTAANRTLMGTAANATTWTNSPTFGGNVGVNGNLTAGDAATDAATVTGKLMGASWSDTTSIAAGQDSVQVTNANVTTAMRVHIDLGSSATAGAAVKPEALTYYTTVRAGKFTIRTSAATAARQYLTYWVYTP